jgi:hypothetical protein
MMGFVSQTASQVLVCEGMRFAKMVGDLNRFFMRFYWPVVLWGQYKRYKRKIIAVEMKMGQEHGKEHLFEHVDALLVSGFGWDSIFVCVEIVFI